MKGENCSRAVEVVGMMKVLITVFLLIAVTFFSAVSLDQGSSLQMGEVELHYQFNEGSGQVIQDSSGNDWDGTAGLDGSEGERDPHWGQGINGSCLEFDGVNDLVICNPFDMPTNAFTIAFWVKIGDNSRRQYPLSYAVEGEDNEVLIYLDQAITIEVDWPNDFTVTMDVRDGKWHHLAFTWRSLDGRISVFVDGSEIANGTVSSGETLEQDGSLCLGYEQDDVGGGFESAQGLTGSMDELLITGAFSDENDIVSLYDEYLLPVEGLEIIPGSGFIDISWDQMDHPEMEAYDIYRVDPSNVRNGLMGSYYNNANLTELVARRIDEIIDFDFGSLSPIEGVDPDTFSISWKGMIKIEKKGNYDLYTTSDDGVRLWIDGDLIIDDWNDHASKENKGTKALDPGYYTIRLDHYDNSLESSISLEMDGPGSPRGPVGSTSLFFFNLTEMELLGTTPSTNFRDSDLDTDEAYFYQIGYSLLDGTEGPLTRIVGGTPSVTTTVFISPHEFDATVGEKIRLNMFLRNDAYFMDWFEISASETYASWVTFEKDEVYLEPNERDYIGIEIAVPVNATEGAVRIDILVHSELNDIYQTASVWIEITTDPVIELLKPVHGAHYGTTDILVTWKTAVISSSVVYLREEGEGPYRTFNGTDGREHFVNLTGLEREKTYEYYVETSSPYGTSTSEPRIFTIGSGVMFKNRIYRKSIDRDYGQILFLDLKNMDDKLHQVRVSVENPYDDLVIGFVGNGSSDRILSTLPGMTHFVKLAIHAQDAIDIDHFVVLNLTTIPEPGEEPMEDHSLVRIDLNHVFVNLSISEISMDPYTLEKRIRVENTDDKITDLKVFAEDRYSSYLNFDPVIDHGKLEEGEVIEIDVSPQLLFSYTPFTSRIYISGYDKVFHIDLDFSPPPGWDVFCASLFPNWGGVPFVDIPPDDMDMDGIKDTDDDDIDGDGIPNNQEPMFSLDTDNDGVINHLDLDDDGDGNPDNSDPWRIDFDNDWYPNYIDPDRDGDGIDNINDTYPDDLDNDQIPNGPDMDDDNDRINDGDDYHPQDHDNDGENDARDHDDDADGIDDIVDTYPYDNDNDGQPDVEDGDWKDGGPANPRSNIWNPNPAPGGSPGNYGGGGGSGSAGGNDWYCTNKPELDLAELIVFLLELGMIVFGLVTGIAAVSATAACIWGAMGVIGGFIMDTAMGSAWSAAEGYFGFSTHGFKVSAVRGLIDLFSRGAGNNERGPTRELEDAYRYYGVSSQNTRSYPQAELNSRGIHYVWQEEINGVSQIFYSHSDSPLKQPEEEIMITNSSVDSVDPYLHTNGGLFLVYAENGASSGEVLIRELEPDGTWSEASSVATSSGMVHEPRFERDDDGLFHVVWADSMFGDYEIMHTYSIAYLHSFHTPERITNSDGNSLQPAIVVDSSDRSHLVWSDTNGSARDIYHVRSNDRGNSWASIESISSSNSRASEPTVVITASDTVHVSWSDHRHGETEIYYRKGIDSADSWEDEVRLTEDATYSELPLLNHIGEDLLLIWHDDRTGVDLRYFRTYNATSEEWSPEKRMPTGIPTIDSLFFEVQLEPRNGDEVKPHNLHLYLDDVLIGSVIDEVPDGKFIFEVPMEVLSAASYQKKEGKLKLKSEHMNPGHYVVAANWKVTWHYTYDNTYLMSEDQYGADMYLRNNMSEQWPTQDPAIYANDIQLSQRSVEVNDTVDVTATIRNQGGISSDEVNVRFYAQEPGNSSRLIGETAIEPIRPHEKADATISWSAVRHTTRIYVVVDEEGLMNELDESNNMAYSRLNVYVMVPPEGSFTINGGEPYTQSSRIFISFETDSENPITHYSLSNDNSTWTDWDPILDHVTWYLDDTTRAKVEGGVDRVVYARFMDIGGLISEVYSTSVEYYPDGPVVVGTSMDDGEVGVDSSIWIEFSNPMDDVTTRSAFVVEPQVDGSFNWVNSTLYFTPNSAWDEGGYYTVYVFDDAGDFADRKLDRDYNWTFQAKEGIEDDDEPPLKDTDGDGMPDDWEDLHGLNKSDPSDASGDLDGDGISNLDEYRDGTDPEVENKKDDGDKNGSYLWVVLPIMVIVILIILVAVVVLVKKRDDAVDWEE